MKFALVNGNKTEATKGARGVCPNCSSEVIAKCGKKKVNHWAHKGNRNCDQWKEAETEWHRSWKMNYPIEWQEVSLTNEKTGEKHIADIRTEHGLVIEFQHSYLDPLERTSREDFYKNMVWVADGTRLKRDYPRFYRAINDFIKTEKKGIYLVDYPEEVFPSDWIESKVPVIFDFKGLEVLDDTNDIRNQLFCLLPLRHGRYAVLAIIPRKAFLKTTLNGEWSSRVRNFIENIIHSKQGPESQKAPRQQPKMQVRRSEPTHYYDPRKRRFKKRWRF